MTESSALKGSALRENAFSADRRRVVRSQHTARQIGQSTRPFQLYHQRLHQQWMRRLTAERPRLLKVFWILKLWVEIIQLCGMPQCRLSRLPPNCPTRTESGEKAACAKNSEFCYCMEDISADSMSRLAQCSTVPASNIDGTKAGSEIED